MRSPAPIDRLTAAYVCVALAFGLAHGPRSAPAVWLLPSALALTAVLALVIAPRARRSGPMGQLLAEIYPLLLTVGLYTHVGLVNVSHGVVHDAVVQRWEAALFGGQPSLAWIRGFPSPAWSTLMHAAYLSFYLILAASPLGLWFAGRRAAARSAAFAMALTFFVCYTIFFAFPVAGPRYSFALPVNAATSVGLARATHRLLEGGSAWGTAFPSSHVAASLVAAVCAWRGARLLGVLLVPAAVLLALGTVYGQFHYAVDAAAGAVLGLVVLVLLPRAGRDEG